MAATPSKRAAAAAKRGGVSAPSGLLGRFAQNTLVRNVVGPLATSAVLAASVNAAQARDRRATNAQTERAASLLQSARSVGSGRPGDGAKKRGIVLPSTRLDGLRGAKPNPLPPGMDIGARLAADQARDRSAQYGAETGELALERVAAAPRAFLEGAPRSYAAREETETQQELTRQRGMMQRAEAFFPSGVGAPEEAPEEETDQRRPRPEEWEAEEAGGSASVDLPPEARARLLRQARDLDVQAARQAKQEEAAQAVQSVAEQQQAMIKANKTARNIAKGVQAATAEAVIPLITLWVQMNLEMLNKWIFHVRIPGIVEEDPNPKPGTQEVVFLGLNCCGCFAFPPMACLPIIGLVIIAVAMSHKWNAFTSVLGSLFNGLF